MTETRKPSWFIPPAIVSALLVLGAHLAVASPARADDPPAPPGTEPSASAPVEVDPNAPGLRLPQGATLAPPKVLDIAQVVEDLGTQERRKDTNAAVTFALQAEVIFPKGAALLNAQAIARIRAIAHEITTQKANRVRVFGFTDNLGSYEDGLRLAKKRADVVQRQLAKDLDAGITYDIRGYSEEYAIADNSTEEGRRKNRRVEVTFLRTARGASVPSV
ncbi:OmpA family protein [Streptomyces sp. NPDC006879]|uniref:OmpA family protein n=1 Tax=Streptomyces sp. NPDC006879 TaxID=3364767 RepID=UPI0036B72CFA